MTEADLWKKVKSAWNETHSVRIESASSFGLHDINTCYLGVEFWTELKIAHGNYFTLQPSQLAWTVNRLKSGAKNLFILLGDEKNDTVAMYKSSELLRIGVLQSQNTVLKASIKNMEMIDTSTLSLNGLRYLLNKIMFTF
jgi:hypothetical protein